MFGTDGNNWIFLVILGVFFVVMIVMTIIPQRKQKKQYQSMMDSLAEGDKVMTTSGIIGKIVSINKDTDRVTLDIGTDEAPVLIMVVKGAIRNKL
ncbi:MAG: preprotein translocase subunit YajC [Firmicutes bacterium ADurb.Bin080]|jgi:preprotein translocase subunit YajC|nr:preprotein translocase subunit YajC [Clostridiales bacterium]OQC14577.1 MAG: preprotein translocase subunit YajC [Firmicutes bacterium ADurb.Bin080]